MEFADESVAKEEAAMPTDHPVLNGWGYLSEKKWTVKVNCPHCGIVHTYGGGYGERPEVREDVYPANCHPCPKDKDGNPIYRFYYIRLG